MKKLRFLFALWVGKACALFTKLFFPTRGSNISGKIACRLCPEFLAHFTGVNPQKTVFITGTNGKSTSNNLAVHAFNTAGKQVATNLEGANQKPGVATTLIKNASFGGRFKKEYLILEIDERNLHIVYRYIPAKYICVTNIEKDQVQRNGDPDYIYQKIRAVINKDVVLFVNNEEPRSKSLGELAGRVVSFGVAKNARKSEKEEFLGVTMPCPLCHDAVEFAYYNVANVGPFCCPTCGFKSDAVPDYCVQAADYENSTFTIDGKDFYLGYKAAHFLYNYVLCYALCAEIGLSTSDLQRAFSTFTNIGGRLEIFNFKEKSVQYIRMKQENPETLQSVLDSIADDKAEKVFMLGLDIVHDIQPNYSNTFYAYDCNFEPFLNSNVERCICFGKTICYDIANRLRYAGLAEDKISILPHDNQEDILKELGKCTATSVYLITTIKMYEDLRAVAKRMSE